MLGVLVAVLVGGFFMVFSFFWSGGLVWGLCSLGGGGVPGSWRLLGGLGGVLVAVLATVGK